MCYQGRWGGGVTPKGLRCFEKRLRRSFILQAGQHPWTAIRSNICGSASSRSCSEEQKPLAETPRRPLLSVFLDAPPAGASGGGGRRHRHCGRTEWRRGIRGTGRASSGSACTGCARRRGGRRRPWRRPRGRPRPPRSRARAGRELRPGTCSRRWASGEARLRC